MSRKCPSHEYKGFAPNVLINLQEPRQITVLVGKDEVRYTLPESILCSHSRLFRNACCGGFVERHEGIVRLSTVHDDVFQLFIEFIYTGGYAERFHQVSWSNDHLGSSLLTNDCEWEAKACLQAWVLGDFLGAELFKLYAIKHVYHTYVVNGKSLKHEAVKYVLAHTVQTTHLRKFMITLVCLLWGRDRIEDPTSEQWYDIFETEPQVGKAILKATTMNSLPNFQKHKVRELELLVSSQNSTDYDGYLVQELADQEDKTRKRKRARINTQSRSQKFNQLAEPEMSSSARELYYELRFYEGVEDLTELGMSLKDTWKAARELDRLGLISIANKGDLRKFPRCALVELKNP